MKATEFQQMINEVLNVAGGYIDNPETIDVMYEVLWDNFEILITEDDRNYN